MPRAPKHHAVLATLRVPLPRTLAPETAAAVCCEVLKPLLFLRAQLPGLYEELCAQARELHALRTQQRVWRLLTTTLRLAIPRTPALTSPRLQLAAPPSADETPPRRRRRVVDRKLSRAVAQLRQLCESLSAEAFAQLAPRSVVLILGTSASRPREAYELRLPPLVLEETADSASTVEPPAGHEARGTAVAADVARRVQRCLVQSLVNAPHAPQGALVAPPTLHGLKLFVLLRAPPGDASAPRSFLPKRTLRPAFYKAKVLRTICAAAGPPPQPDASLLAAQPLSRGAPPPTEAPIADDGTMWCDA